MKNVLFFENKSLNLLIMRFTYFIFLLFSVSTGLFSQDCKQGTLKESIYESMELDSVYLIDIDFRIKYYAKLSKEILPKYSMLKSQIKEEIKNSDLEKIQEIAILYDNTRKILLNEIKESQRRIYQDVNAYSKLNSILIFETLDLFPDSYALLTNKSRVGNQLKDQEYQLILNIFSNYEHLLQENNDCINSLFNEMSQSKKELNIIEIFQNTGNKIKSETRQGNLIDLLIWAIN